MATHEPYPGTQAVLRAIHLLKAFSDAHPELSLIELTRRVDLNKTTAYRLLTALESEGLVVRNPETEAYRLGPEVIALGARAARANDLRSASRLELIELAQQIGETASLEALQDGQVLILDEAPGAYLIGATQFIGTRWPAHATSTGKVLLAHLPEAELKAMLARPLAQLTAKTLTAPEALRRELVRIREQGYAVAADELEVGSMAVGAPILNHQRQIVAAISVHGPGARLTPDRLPEVARQIKAAAERISIRLGFKPE